MGCIKRAYQELMKISEKYERFDDEKVENIIKELIRNEKIFTVGIHQALYQYIQRAATKLGYMDIKKMDLGTVYILENDDYLKIVEKIWEYITSGILAPGRDRTDTWFPNLHLTERGREFFNK